MTIDTRPYILIAEDDFIAQSFFEESLAHHYQVSLVENGQYFFEAIHEKKPDLVILDISMPIMDGIETCRALRERVEYDDVPVILASAEATQKIVDDCEANDFLVKPFSEKQLISAIEKNLSQLK